MRSKRRAAALLIVLVLVLTLLGGCKDDGKEKTDPKNKQATGMQKVKSGNGRFFENEVPLPNGIGIKNIVAMRKLSGGVLQIIARKDNNSYVILKSKDLGKTWDTVKISGLKKEFLPHAAIDPDGNAALFHYAKNGIINISLTGADGKAKLLPLKFSTQSNGNKESQVQQGAYSNSGNLIIRMSDNSLYMVDSKGVCTRAFDTGGIGINYFGMAGNVLAAIHNDGMILFDTDTEKTLEQISPLEDFLKKNKELASCNTDNGQPMVFSEGTEKDSMMFANKEGIFHFSAGGSVIEQLMDGTMTSFSSGNSLFYDMAVMDKNNIFIAANTGGESKLFHYSYDKKASSAPDTELNVYALDESIFLRQAVTLFQKTYPDIHVNLEIGLSGKDGVTLEDALTVLNTNILAGKGPDVLILDGMPTDSYIEKGVLEDISDIVKEVEEKEGLFSNIVESVKQNNKIYAMPVRLIVPIVEGDKTTVKAGGDIEALAKRAQQLKSPKAKSSFDTPIKGPESLLRDLYYADSARWKKEDGSIDKKILTDYLRCAKQMYDADRHNSKIEERMDSYDADGTLETGEKLGSHRYDGLLTGDWKYSFGTMSSIYDLQTLCSTKVQTKTDYCLMNHEKVKSYIPYLQAGVSKNGNTDAGKKFVKLLLEKKAGNSQSNGIPVNCAAFDEVCKEKLDAQNVKDESSVNFSRQGSDKSYGFKYINLKQKDIDTFTEMIKGLEKPTMTNRVIQKIILEQGKKYLLDKQNLEDTAESILKKVNLYLAE